jgi:trigger factor
MFMKFEVLKSENLSRSYKITIPAKTIAAEVENRLKAISGRVNIPGFRKGKAPKAVVQKQYGDAAYQEAIEKSLNNSFVELEKAEKIAVIGEPKIEIKSDKSGEDVVYEAAFEIYPEITELDYSKITTEKCVIPVDEAKVEEQLAQFSKTFGTDEDVNDRDVAEDGDTTTIDYEGFLDGTPFDGGKAEKAKLTLGSNQFIPGFEEQIVGKKVGSEFDVNVSFPTEYHSADLAGKAVVFKIKLHGLASRKAAEINDEFATKFGLKDLEELKSKVREQLAAQTNEVAYSYTKKTLFDNIAGQLTFELPVGLVAQEAENIKRQITQADGGAQPEDAAIAKLAHRRVALGLYLSEVGQKNGIKITERELNDAVLAEARKYRGQEQQVIDFYKKNPNMVSRLTGPILEDKAVELILSKAKVVEVSKTTEEVIASLETAEV